MASPFEDDPPLAWGGESPRLRPGSLVSSAGGLLARLSAVGVGRGAAASSGGGPVVGFGPSDSADLEQPLLPGGVSEEAHYLEHVLEPKQWPTLRGSSVSTRRITPGLLSLELGGAAAAAAVTSPRAGAAGVAEGAWPPATQQPDDAAEAAAPAAGLPAAGKPAAAPARQPGRYGRASVAGAINSAIALPVQLSFAAIIFRVSFKGRYSRIPCGCCTR